ncbi:MAG: terpene cyclase/mutase family protein [Planctomycetaceae bacterium]|jgi:geranylgeranyl transferase type-2 subunit beta|nr:terpene cyclase/mutase family protein [Planctomycetaceae bacterium]
MSTNIFTQLALRLASGIVRFPETYRENIASFIFSEQDLSTMKHDYPHYGGFRGRRGAGELYYTGFALRGLALLGKLNAEDRVIDFLRECIDVETWECTEIISLLMASILVETATGRDIFAEKKLIRTDWGLWKLSRFQCPDGGFSSSAETLYSSTYHTFLVVCLFHLLGLPIDKPQKIVQLILQRQREDGGFVELPPLYRSGVSPTVAAVCLLKLLDAEHHLSRKTVEFFLSMKREDGGFKANAVAPVSDLLSTHTALVALCELDAVLQMDLSDTELFVDSLWKSEGGGYIGGIWDTVPDVEYTFYGTAVKSLLASLQ